MEATQQNGAGQIYQLIPKVMADVGAIGKGRRNPQQGYQFRGIDDVYNAMQSALAAHGVFVVPEVTAQHREDRQTKSGGTLIYTVLTIRHTFYAPDGSNVAAVTIGEAMDSGDKSSNKAMSAGIKYALLEVFCIPTEEPKDTENDSPEPAPRQQQRPTPSRPVAAPKKPAEPDPLDDDDHFKTALAEAFRETDFDQVGSDHVIEAVLKGKKAGSLEDLSLRDRNGFIKAVKDRKFDQYRTLAPAAA